MKVKNKELVEAKEALDKLIQERLPVKVAWGLAKTGKKFNDSLDAFVVVRDGLLKTYKVAVENTENGVTHLAVGEGGNLEKFNTELEDLLVQEVEMVVDVVVLPEMVDGVALQMEPQILMALEKFIVVED